MMTQGYVLICISMKVILFGLVTLTLAYVLSRSKQNDKFFDFLDENRLMFVILSGPFQSLFWKKERFWRLVVTATISTYALMMPTSTMAASPLMFSLADSIGMMPSNMPHNDDVAVVWDTPYHYQLGDHHYEVISRLSSGYLGLFSGYLIVT